MNTDKLMELVEKFITRKRCEADEYDRQRSSLTRFDNDHKQVLSDAAREARADADELAAALRAEQAVDKE